MIETDHWLTRNRLQSYPYVFLGIYLLVAIYWIYNSNGYFDMRGHPLGTDFASFYTAAKLALQGKAAYTYDFTVHFAAQKEAFGSEHSQYYSFSYPPTFLLILIPFGMMPYFMALTLWLGLTLIFFITMLKKITGRKETILLSLAFPAIFLTIGHGQNAFLTSGLLAGGLYYLDRKPILAGIFIGLLSFKPHLGLLIPIVLVISAHWRVFFYATLTMVSFVVLSWLAFGTETWTAFLQSASATQNTLNSGVVALYKMQSLFASIRYSGADLFTAYAAHSILALIVIATVIWIWTREVSIHLKHAALCVGTLLITPFLLDYDLTILAIPIAYLVVHGLKNGLRPQLINILCLVWIAPLVLRSLNLYLLIPWTPILLSTLLYQIVMVCREKLAGKQLSHD